jgi:hypothetical protein
MEHAISTSKSEQRRTAGNLSTTFVAKVDRRKDVAIAPAGKNFQMV